MMQMLRYEVLGKDRFDAAFREYIRTWAFKHPTPADFFRMMRDESGMELDWFWRDWIFTTARLDQSVDSVSCARRRVSHPPRESRDDGDAGRARDHVRRWHADDREAAGRDVESRRRDSTIACPEKKRVQRVEVDPRHALPGCRSNEQRLAALIVLVGALRTSRCRSRPLPLDGKNPSATRGPRSTKRSITPRPSRWAHAMAVFIPASIRNQRQRH